jgi:hypothetical protein
LTLVEDLTADGQIVVGFIKCVTAVVRTLPEAAAAQVFFCLRVKFKVPRVLPRLR